MQPTTRIIATPSLTFHALEAGSGPLALCLHGFPDDAHTWRHQMPALVDAGYHVVAPFMRGYAPTAQPADGRYDVMALGEDVAALLEALDAQDAVVIGHDWGAVATYFGALLAAPRIRAIVTLAVPYGPAFFQALREDYAQQRRSWYMVFFQHRLADEALARNDFAFIERLWRDWSPAWTPPAETLEAVRETFRRPGTAAAALAYYRASMGPVFEAPPEQLDGMIAGMGMPIAAPALYLHGADDGCQLPEVAARAEHVLRPPNTFAMVDGAGHFLQLERPDEVNELVAAFL